MSSPFRTIYTGPIETRIASQSVRLNYGRMGTPEDSRSSEVVHNYNEARAWGDLRYLYPKWFKPTGELSDEQIGPSAYLATPPGWEALVYAALVDQGWTDGRSLFLDTAFSNQHGPWTEPFTLQVAALGRWLGNPKVFVNAWATEALLWKLINSVLSVSKEIQAANFAAGAAQAIDYMAKFPAGRYLGICNVLYGHEHRPQVQPVVEAARRYRQFVCVRVQETGKEVPVAELDKMFPAVRATVRKVTP